MKWYKLVTYFVAASGISDFLDNIEEAAQEWTTANLGVTFKEYDSSTDEAKSVVIRGYDVGDDEGCRDVTVAGCVVIAGDYPHLGDDIEFYLRKFDNWTDDWTAYKNSRGGLRYLPFVLVHEFGHTIGLGHSGASDDVMSPGEAYRGCLVRNFDDGCTSRCGFTQNDRDATTNLYPTVIRILIREVTK